MFEAKIVKVVIASPGDVVQERNMVKEVIDEWNIVNAEHKKLFLMPIGWETHSFPEIGDRPQAIINRQIIKDADLLVAVFWTRLGTPTGESPSGTIEEIEEHIKAEKPVMIYFSSVPVRIDSVDEEQYKLLKEFKDEYMDKGLVETFETLSEFRQKFSRHLGRMINHEEPFVTYQEKTESESSEHQASGTSFGLGDHLSEDHQRLLIGASKDKSGTILVVETLGGLSVSTNKKQFVSSKDAREEAKWRAIIQDLQGYGLIQDRGYKGEVFAITDRGYRVVDEFILNQ